MSSFSSPLLLFILIWDSQVLTVVVILFTWLMKQVDLDYVINNQWPDIQTR